ncbi:Kunitz trypsin inhibitor [Quillaja saponaria]|uniref:Kunitz trypsin inhibitor n=1 Tax=Quillaja saponaria TaxID=32244 RepID=A0AAD7VGY7_QUISA|nr:Kunitz trypsin inhibitor [Quillaja saponaria]
MKPAALTIFLLLALMMSTKPSVVHGQVVLDAEGEPLEWGRDYYILPASWGIEGGGVSLGSYNNSRCPLYVVQDRSILKDGLAASFSSITKDRFVRASTDLIITTTGPVATCKLSMVWKLVHETGRRWLVSTNGNAESINSLFQIVPYKSIYYTIRFCPTPTDIPTLCKGLGLYVAEDKTRYLALSDDHRPYLFKFRKAVDPYAAQPLKTVVSV